MGNVNQPGRWQRPQRPERCPLCGCYCIPPKELGGVIRWHRQRLHLTQEALGELLGVSAHQIANWEREGLDSIHRLKRLAAIFGIAPWELLGE